MGPSLTGNIYGSRLGSETVVHTFPVKHNTLSEGDTVPLTVINASEQNPVQVEFSVQVVTGVNSDPVQDVALGTSRFGDQIFGAEDISFETAGYYPASNDVDKFRFTEPTTIYFTFLDSSIETAGTQGHLVVFIKESRTLKKPIV